MEWDYYVLHVHILHEYSNIKSMIRPVVEFDNYESALTIRL